MTNDDARTTLVDATPPAVDTRRYAVCVTYTEPRYAATRGIPEVKYEGQFSVSATSFEHAVSLGLAAFHEAAMQSGVSWERRVVKVLAEVTTE